MVPISLCVLVTSIKTLSFVNIGYMLCYVAFQQQANVTGICVKGKYDSTQDIYCRAQ